jgi:hypothetical protein
MRKITMAVGFFLAILLAACAPAGSAEPPVQNTPEGEPTSPALNPAPGAGEESPAAEATGDTDADGDESTESAYPAPGLESLPEGYPGLVAPSTVDLSQLTPVPGNETPQVMPAPGRPGNDMVINQSPVLEATMLDLSRYLDVPVDDIELVQVEAVTWPNAGLGCPEEGMAYAEVMVEGSRITLLAEEQLYTYHTAGNGEFVLCVDGERVSSGIVPR